MEVLPITEREIAYRSIVDIQDIFDQEEVIDDFVREYNGDVVSKEDAKIVAAGFAIEKARQDGSLFRFLTVKTLLEKDSEFGSIDESEASYLKVFNYTIESFKKGFIYNMAKSLDTEFYNDELKKLLFG